MMGVDIALLVTIGEAALVVVVGYLVSLLVASLFTKAYRRSGLKDYAEKHGYEKAFFDIELEHIGATLLKWWVFLAFILQAVGLLNLTYLTGFASTLLEKYQILALAVVFVVVGAIVGLVAGRLAEHIYKYLGIEEFMEKRGYEKGLIGIDLSTLLREIVRWWVFLVFFVQAATVLGFDQIERFSHFLVEIYTRLVAAVVYFIIGAFAASYISDKIRESGAHPLVAVATRVVVLYVAAISSLSVIGFSGILLLNRVIEYIAMGLAAAIALGLGLAVGLGGQDIVKELWQERKR